MLKALSTLIKLALFSFAILLAGQWVHWKGHTLAQHADEAVMQAERSHAASYVRGFTQRVTEDAREGIEKKFKTTHSRAPATSHASTTEDRIETQSAAPEPEVRTVARSGEKLPPSERQKLRALIRELNSAQD